MTANNNFYCVILAGGKGRRLWPCSRESYPKQFIDFFGMGRTQLQQTYDRALKTFQPDHIFINTNRVYADIVREQLPGVDDDHLMVEPIWRNTAPSVAWAIHRINHFCKSAVVAVMPSDQAVQNEEAFQRDLLEGLDFAVSNNCLLTMGVKPTRPEPGYGYIQMGDSAGNGFYRVKSFTEKPEREFAEMFMQSGEWYWNTGIFLCNVKYGWECFSRFMPSVLRVLEEREGDSWTVSEENAIIETNFPLYPNISVDYGILEKSDNVYVMECNFGWADLGTWHSIYEACRKSDGDNVVVDSDVLIENSAGNVIKLPKDRLGVISGLNGYIVAEQGNVLLICKKEDSSALVRKYAAEVQMKKGENFI